MKDVVQLSTISIVNDPVCFYFLHHVGGFSSFFSSSPSPLLPGTWRNGRWVSNLIKQLHTFNIFILVEAPGEGRSRRRKREEGRGGMLLELLTSSIWTTTPPPILNSFHSFFSPSFSSFTCSFVFLIFCQSNFQTLAAWSTIPKSNRVQKAKKSLITPKKKCLTRVLEAYSDINLLICLFNSYNTSWVLQNSKEFNSWNSEMLTWVWEWASALENNGLNYHGHIFFFC